MPERMMGREGAPVLVNGQIEPTVTVTPGGYERWRIINACTARFLRLRADGAELLQTAGDAGPLAEPASVSEVTLATGNRAELLVRIAEAGRHRLVAEPVDRGTPLHLHVWPMQVVTRNGRASDGSPQWLHVVNVPAEGTVTVLVRFSDFPGRTVYHFHILDHEDLGMMAVVDARA
jgi:FtsP/CotA-like multicopper oxidase with cupredoxin domain